MRIGIFTLPLHVNHGGVMQAYALQEVLKTLGHDVWILKHSVFGLPKKIPLKTRYLVYAKRFLCKYFFSRRGEVLWFWPRKEE